MARILCLSLSTCLDDVAHCSALCCPRRYLSVSSMGCTRRSCFSVMTSRRKTCCSCCARPLRSRRETWWRPCCQVRRATWRWKRHSVLRLRACLIHQLLTSEDTNLFLYIHSNKWQMKNLWKEELLREAFCLWKTGSDCKFPHILHRSATFSINKEQILPLHIHLEWIRFFMLKLRRKVFFPHF